jgi:hypothetical protein
MLRSGGCPGTRASGDDRSPFRDRGGVVLFHSGLTFGSSAALAIRPDAKRAAIVLSNGTPDANDIVLHAMVVQVPIVTELQPQVEVAVDPEVLKEYAGMYSVSPDISIQVTPNKEHPFVQATGSPQSELASSGKDTFFDLKKPSTKIRFHRDKSGMVDVLELDLGGGVVVPAKRLR